MSNLIVTNAKGFSKEEAAKNANFTLGLKFDATAAFKSANTEDLEAFAAEYIEKKVKGAVGVGFYIALVPGKADTRLRPYTTQNIPGEGTRKFKMAYQLVTENSVILDVIDSKSEALEAAKEYVTAGTAQVITLSVIKVVTEGNPVAGVVTYTPSVGAQEGEYVFFGSEA